VHLVYAGDEMNAHRTRTRADEIEDRIAESIAAKVIEIVRAEFAPEAVPPVQDDFMDAKDVARLTGFSRAWVYANAGRLGAYEVESPEGGESTRPRLRFDPQLVSDFMKRRGRREAADARRAAKPAAAPHHVPRVSAMAPKRKAQ
jgi:hypothetical protein